MPKIIINYAEGIEPWTALQAVKEITKEGRVSSARGVSKYCHATKFNAVGIVVECGDRHSEGAADSFYVYPLQSK